MNDPHIDIDEIDNPQSAPGLGDSGTDTPPKEPATGWGFSDLLERMGQQAGRWQDRLNAGARMGMDVHIMPPEVKKHMISSQREFLLAWRALIDYSLEKLDSQEQRETTKPPRPAAAPPKVTKIQVEEVGD